MTDKLIKMSARQNRDQCPECGTTELYWAREASTGEWRLIDRTYSTKNIPRNGEVDPQFLHVHQPKRKYAEQNTDAEGGSDNNPQRGDGTPENGDQQGQGEQQQGDNANGEQQQQGDGEGQSEQQIEQGAEQGSQGDQEQQGEGEGEGEGEGQSDLDYQLMAVDTESRMIQVPPGDIIEAAVKAAQQAMGQAVAEAGNKAKAEAIEAATEAAKDAAEGQVQVKIIDREGVEVLPREEGAVAHFQLADVFTIVASGEHCMMVGPTGSGKSSIARMVAEMMGLDYGSLSLTSQTAEARILGYKDAHGNYHSTLFRRIWEHGGLFNFDEIDHGNANIIGVINEALANGVMAFADGMVAKHATTVIVCTANTYGLGGNRHYVGAAKLDAATLDRFTSIFIEYDLALEKSMCKSTGLDRDEIAKVLQFVRKLRKAADKAGIEVIFSPRGSHGMCKLLKAGYSWDNAVRDRLQKDIDSNTWAKLAGV